MAEQLHASPLIVLRCTLCGDTYPATGSADPCPSCGSRQAEPAAEPLL